MRRILWPAATSLFFAGSYVAAKLATSDLEPISAALLRYLIALGFLLTLLVSSKTPRPKLTWRQVPDYLLLGATGILGYHYFFFKSLDYTTVGNTAVINAFSPVVTGILAAALLGERLSRRNVAGVLLAVGGVLLLVTGGRPERLLAWEINRGDGLMLLSVACWAVYAVRVRRVLETTPTHTVTLFATVFGIALMLQPALAEGFVEQVSSMSAVSFWAVFYMGVGASGLGYLLYNVSIRELGPTRTSSFVYGVLPVLVAVAARLVFGEPLTMVLAASIVLIVVGLRLTLKSS